ncbi:unnamed protein product [Cylindrotheca closterium]|uniref:Nudix hydrolase domain-containing protein n=1 Tax=Cylindrotheca closterium TaxID=2856 RepID=A0AAD2FBK4_9STRA|nr:unnamed protein product [Cylindrotheca closterium]
MYRCPIKSHGEFEERKPLPRWLSVLPPSVRKVIGSPLLTIAIVVLLLQVYAVGHNSSNNSNSSNSKSSKKSIYKGTQFWNDEDTLDVKTLYETPFARFQIHKVKAGKNIINDWLWYDEMDAVNILVQEAESGKFVLFRQKKYANPGPPTLAIVGGLIEPGETSLEAAKRELMEELQMASTDWISMGKYRVSVNRGGGHTHTFLAKNAVKVTDNNVEVVGQADWERQDVVKCTEEELLQYVLDGKFGEIKWTATVAMSLLRLRS